MRSRDRHPNVATKLRRRKPSKEKTSRSEKSVGSLTRSSWPKAMNERAKESHSRIDDSESSASRFSECSATVDTNDSSNIIARDIVELFGENGDIVSHDTLEERTTCSRISSSTTELDEEDTIDMCSTCKNCAECQLQQSAGAKMRGAKDPSNERAGEELSEHFDYHEGDAGETTSTSNTSIEYGIPVLVDLTSEESKAAWKQTILKRYEPRIMIADSSSRLQRGSTSSSLATALRDRGPCVIPVQPNRSLPIRPAPPTPTRPASIVTSRKVTRSPILKLPRSASLAVDVAEVQSERTLSGALTSELSEFVFEQQNGKSDEMMLTASELIDRTNYVLPTMTNIVQITQEVNSGKRKNSGEDRDRKYEKELTKDAKKRRKSHETDSHACDEQRIDSILKEYSRACSSNSADKGEKKSQHMLLRLWDDKRCSSVVSTTDSDMERAKVICNRVVPPLRLKKVVREASTDEYRKVEVSAESEHESNYRIVTGATPRPESPSGYSVSTFWDNITAEKEEIDAPTTRDKSRRTSSPKSDGYKIKYRRDRLRMKLQELRGKALELSHEMAVRGNTDTSLQRSTRLRQMMNCYEKQIENVSKLLCKLSASIPPTSADDVVDPDYENELDDLVEKTIDGNMAQTVNGTTRSSAGVSPSPSPEPPKLSPSSPVDYQRSKPPEEVRNTPPMLPRVYIAIQPTALECLKQNIITSKTWHETSGEDASSSSIEKSVKVDDTMTRGNITDGPAVSPISLSEFDSCLGSGATGWESSTNLSTTLNNSEIEEKISDDAKTFDDAENHGPAISSISSDSFLDSTMNMEIDASDAKDTKESAAAAAAAVASGCLDEATQTSETTQAANKQTVCEKQESEKKSSDALPSSIPIHQEIRKATEYGTYDSERINGDSEPTASNVVPQVLTMADGRSQVSTASNVTNILQLQSNYYGSSVARDNVVLTGVVPNSRNVQKVTSSQSATLDPITAFPQSGSIVSSSNQQCVVLPNSCNNETVQETVGSRNDGNRIMTEQFPTLGNWLARMSKKQTTKSKSKLQSGMALPSSSTAEVRIPSLEGPKARASMSSSAIRNNIVNVAPQWNTERWQRQQQRQQQLYTATSSAAPGRSGICPPISVTQFYPPNYTIDSYGAAFGYPSAICPCGDCTYHSRVQTTAPPMNGYQIPLQDPHATPLRQMQHLDKRYPHLQEAATRHFATDLLKYPAALSASGSYQHTAAAAAAAAAAGLDFDRLRTTATQNGTAPTAACLPSLLLPPPPPLSATTQQARTAPLIGYPPSNGQCGRNRMIPDVVAAAAAAAVVAAASFGRQRGPLPPYSRADAEIVSAGISGVIDNESTQLIANRATSRERLPEQVQSVAGSAVNVDPRLNKSGYRQLQNLILDRLPYVKTDDTYSQSGLYGDNAQEAVASAVSSSTYQTPIPTSGVLIAKESVSSRKESRNCDTPHLGKVNRTLEAMNNLECSNCGLAGSMFKCLGCESAFYCDERCQIRHWSIHVEKCPKRMPKLKKLI